MTSKIILLNTKPKNYTVSYVIFSFLVIIFLVYSYFLKTYDIYNATGIIKCDDTCTIDITIPYYKTEIFGEDSFIKYENKKYKINSIEFDDPYLDNNIPVEDITLYTDIITDKKLINFQILYNKQRIITKIKNTIAERN